MKRLLNTGNELESWTTFFVLFGKIFFLSLLLVMFLIFPKKNEFVFEP